MQIQRLETGARRLSDHWIYRLAPILGVTPGQLLGGGGVAVVGHVGAGGSIVFDDQTADGVGFYTVEAPADVSGEIIGLEIRGDSQWPMFREGYVVLVSKHEGQEIEPLAMNDWAVCRLADGQTLLKILRAGSEPGTYSLESLNAPPIENQQLAWATAVKGWLTNAR